MTISESTVLSDVTVHRIAGHLGAEIRGIKLGPDLSQSQLALIRRALLDHKVVFFRGQSHLDDKLQEGFARLLGEPVAHPTVPVAEGSDFVLELDSDLGGRANSWHTDVTFVDAYPKASVLRAITVPEAGGDTVWADTAAAFRELPAPLQKLAEQLHAIHTNDYDYAGSKPEASSELIKQHQEVFVSTLYETEHPVVHVHPDTSEKHLLTGHFVKRFVGLSTRDSEHLFAVLQGHVTRLENTVRWRWRAGDVAVWDNRATQHYAINDYGASRRVMHRVTVAGNVPVSVDGFKSNTLKRIARTERSPSPKESN